MLAGLGWPVATWAGRAAGNGTRPLLCPEVPEPLVDRGRAETNRIGHFGGLPLQHVTQQQNRALPGRQMLQGSHERQPDRLAITNDR